MHNLEITGAFGEKPALSFADSDSSPELQIEVLHQGDGREVTAGDMLSCHYLGQIWNGQVFDNSFDRGQPLVFQIGVGMVIEGWDEGLLGQRVGSRVVLSIPSDLGYGPAGVPQAGIGGGDTLVFVTDILDARAL